jgi:hypothetical protein
MTPEQLDEIHELLRNNYYVILTRNNSHLSTYFVAIGNKLATGKWGFWGHALMNMENDNDPNRDSGFKLMESTGVGVHYSSFYEVFQCDSVALLKPKNVTHEEWLEIMEKLLLQDGKKYDNLFDLVSDKEVSCVELVRTALQALPDYNEKFANLEAIIAKDGNNLTPDMFYNCPDFECVYEVVRK